VQCKVNKKLPAGPRPTHIVTVGPKMVGGLPRAAYVFMNCFHCAEPWCVAACPTKAMQKRESDGIVFVDHEICVGCKACIRACPWGAPQWHKETRKVVKCDLCKDRVDEGLDPACVTVCPAGSLSFGESVEELTDIRRRRHAQDVAHLG
jgi:Fe-S-cluster-containing dehydrogenase component